MNATISMSCNNEFQICVLAGSSFGDRARVAGMRGVLLGRGIPDALGGSW